MAFAQTFRFFQNNNNIVFAAYLQTHVGALRPSYRGRNGLRVSVGAIVQCCCGVGLVYFLQSADTHRLKCTSDFSGLGSATSN